MKKTFIIIGLMAACAFWSADSYAQKRGTAEQWKLRPEFTVRESGGFVTSGPSVTASLRINERRSLGIMVGHGDTYVDGAPGDIYAVQTCLFMRRYLYLGRQRFVALYSDLAVGTDYIYKVDGRYRLYPVDWTSRTHYASDYMFENEIDHHPGELEFYAAWQPGVRFRFFGNVHLFFGPSISTNNLGVHLGLGF